MAKVKSTHLEEQIKTSKWWRANKQIIRKRIINSFDLPKNWQGIQED
jgi:hypothetical protein